MIISFWTRKCVLDNELYMYRKYLLGYENDELTCEVCQSGMEALFFFFYFPKMPFDLEGAAQRDLCFLVTNE